MSKENTNLRLLGSPVNLTYRSKKKDDKKNFRNRPKSALQNSCFTPDNPERYKRPFSADNRERRPSTKNFLNTFSEDFLQSKNNTLHIIKIVAPTTEILGDTSVSRSNKKKKDFCSNASDYGSEDTYMSLGTKIKAKAQVSKTKPQPKNFLKYRNIIKKRDKHMASNFSDNQSNEYGLNIKITEKQTSLTPSKNYNLFDEKALSPSYKTRSYESYFIPIESEFGQNTNALTGRVSFGNPNTENDVLNNIHTYTKRLALTKQQLSLVEEESINEFDSVPSQNASSLSPENSVEEIKNSIDTVEEETALPYSVGTKKDYPQKTREVNEARTYTSFYDDFHSNEPYKSKMSSTVYNDASSKDSGYHDVLLHDDQYKKDYSLPPTTLLVKKSQSHEHIEEQPKSLNFSRIGQNYSKTYPSDKKAWAEPMNHSRLLYKNFFLQKEGHIAVPPQNSPNKVTVVDTPGTSNIRTEVDHNEYPHYLLNSSTKAYTSRVIEDYKKELETINNLHELTLKDIKTDAVSPMPYNIDTMFDDHHKTEEIQSDVRKVNEISESPIKRENDRRVDILKVSTEELIHNYWKVKDNNFTKDLKQNKKLDSKITNFSTDLSNKKLWNNKKPVNRNNTTLETKNHTQKNLFTISNTPQSARIESVQNDKDIDSWMSLSAPSPRYLETSTVEKSSEHNEFANGTQSSTKENVQTANNMIDIKDDTSNNNVRDSNEVVTSKPELDSKSTVLDIYSMLKEIESFGERPVTSVTNTDITATEEPTVMKNEERAPTPKDNFMEIFEFLEKVEQSANQALSVVTSTTPTTIPKLEVLLKLPHTELAQRLVTASLQLEERSCCIALLQESLANHKEQMVAKVNNLERQSMRNVAKVKYDCEEAIKRHQSFIDQLINDKKTLNHRIEQLVDERRSLEERWKRQSQTLEEKYKLELRNQHDKMAAAQQVARQRWVRQKAEKIKELTVKGLEGELREMAERQQKEIADLKMAHAEQMGKAQAKHSVEIEELRKQLEDEKESALLKERQLASSRMEKQILELELTYQEQRRHLVAQMRAENERVAAGLGERERMQRDEMEKWKEEQEKLIEEKKKQLEEDIINERAKLEEQMKQKGKELEDIFEQYKKDFEAEQQMILKRKVSEISAQHKLERDKEIEKAIESMEAEAQAGRKELQDAIRRNKEQYEGELKELAETEQATLRRYQEAQQRVRQTEDKCAELEVSISQLETRNKVLVEKNSQLEAQLAEVRASCEQSWQNTVDNLKREMEDLKKTHDEQMHQLYAKVKVAVARKDSAIQALTREAAKYQEKITILEQKLQQQRKDFFKQK